jgi:CRISPR-associated endonuclease Cas1
MQSETVQDRLDAIEQTYGQDGDGRVVVVDGFCLRLRVHHGALVVADGVGETRRERSYPKVRAPARLVVRGAGTLTTAALRWCHAQGVGVLVLTGDRITLAASPPGRDDPRVRRQQALAGNSQVGLEVVRHVLKEKLLGQARVLAMVLHDDDGGSTLLQLLEALDGAETVDECRQLEASAASVYFAAWTGHPATAVGFVAKDRRRVPPHWQTFDSRRSAITGAANTNRLAERPLNAILNYGYRLAEVEARFALVRLGLDPGLGVLHADTPGRDSLALDVLEPVRPKVDGFVLDLIAERTFHKRTFAERSDGHVRVAAPLTHELAETMPTWARAVAPHAEAVAHIFAGAVPGKIRMSTPLSNRTAIAAQAAVRARKQRPPRRKALPPERAATSFAACLDCGGPLERPRHIRCASCWERQPAQSRQARRARGYAIAAARKQQDAWRAAHPGATPGDFTAIREHIQAFTLSQIQAATGVSKTTASSWRSGKTRPHLSYWSALERL